MAKSLSKLYFAEFTDKRTHEKFYKFGYTRFHDAAARFRVEPEQYAQYDIKILASFVGPAQAVYGAEDMLKSLFPKNLRVEVNFSGVTEIVKLTEEEVTKIIRAYAKMKSTYAKETISRSAQ